MKYYRFRKTRGAWQLKCEYCGGAIQKGTHYIRQGRNNAQYWHEACAEPQIFDYTNLLIDGYGRTETNLS